MVVLLVQKIVSLFLMMIIGFVIVRCKVLKTEDSVILSRFIVYGVCPLTILSAFQVEMKPEIRQGMILAFISGIVLNLLIIVITELLTRIFHFSALEKASVIYSNAANLIIPIVSYVLGAEWVIYTSAYITVQSILIWSHGCSLVSGEKNIDLKKILTNINLIAVFAGLIFLVTGFRLPGILADTTSSMGNMVGPLSMVVTGMLIAGKDLRKVFADQRVWLVAANRLLIVPVILLAFLKFSGLSGFAPDGNKILLISFLSAMGPTAATITNQAQVYGRNSEYAGAINAVTSFLCMFTMPLMVYLYQM